MDEKLKYFYEVRPVVFCKSNDVPISIIGKMTLTDEEKKLFEELERIPMREIISSGYKGPALILFIVINSDREVIYQKAFIGMISDLIVERLSSYTNNKDIDAGIKELLKMISK